MTKAFIIVNVNSFKPVARSFARCCCSSWEAILMSFLGSHIDVRNAVTSVPVIYDKLHSIKVVKVF
jgi:hypothetical protein